MSNLEESNKRIVDDGPETVISRALPYGFLTGSALIIVSILIAYYPCLRGGFILDDDLLLTDNYLVKFPDGLNRFWFTAQASEYYPITNTLFWLEWRVWGMNPTGYRTVNLALHMADALLIWFILRKLLIPGAFLAALIFAVHPVNVESVAWIAQLRNVLMMFFFLLSIWSYLKADMRAANRDTTSVCSQGGSGELVNGIPSPFAPSSSRFFYWLSLLLFILAMFSKGSAAVLPVLLLGIIWWLRQLTKRDLIRTAPFFLVAVVLTGVNIWFQTHGSGEVIRSAGFTERLLGAGGVVWFYLYKALLPFNLCFIYPKWQIQTGNPLWWAPLIAALAVTAVLWRYGKGWSRPFLFAWGFFCVALMPVMGFTDVGFMIFSLVADHYQHIAIIGVIAPVAAGCEIWRRGQRKSSWVASVIAVTALGTLVALTWRQTSLYGNVIRLYQATAEKNPQCCMVHELLGGAFDKAGRKREAIEQFQQALSIKPDSDGANNYIGVLLYQEGHLPEAIEHFKVAIKSNPHFSEPYNNIGSALLYSGSVQKSIFYFEQSLKKNPFFAEAYNNMGIAQAKTGQVQSAKDSYEHALNLKPDYAGAHINLGFLLLGTGQSDEAIEHFKQAVRLAPNDPDSYKNLGIAMAGAGQPKEAIRLFERALTLKADSPDAHFQYGLVLAEQGRKYEAIEHLEQALKLIPESPEVNYNLGLTLANIGRTQEAIEYLIQAIKLKPDNIDAYSNLMFAYAKLDRVSEAVATAQKALDVARSTGQREQAKQIESWLNSYRDGLREDVDAKKESAKKEEN